MTTTIYDLLYPHPSIPLNRCVVPCSVDSKIYLRNLTKELTSAFLHHAEDLPSAVLWEAEDAAVKGIPDGLATQGLRKRIRKSVENTKLKFPLVQPAERHFPSGPKAPSEDWVHILVVTPEVVKHLYEIGDLFGDLEHMEAWSALTMEMKNLVSPADTAKNPAFMKGTAENLAAWDRYGPLTALFSEHLAILRHELEESDQFPNPICATCTRQLIEGSARFYDSGAERETVLQPILRKLISGKAYWQARLDNKLARPDGVWIEEHFAYVVVEIKNESESAGDLILQGLAVYSKILAQDKSKPHIGRSNMPIILLAIRRTAARQSPTSPVLSFHTADVGDKRTTF